MKLALESQGTLARIWAKRGTRPRIKRDRRFTWAYLFGAICPARGTGAALVMPTVSIDAMNKHLVEISKCASVSAIALMILDGAGWHGSPRLVVPDNIVLRPLPPYAPDQNPIDPSAEAMGRAARLWHHRRFMQWIELPHEPLLMIWAVPPEPRRRDRPESGWSGLRWFDKLTMRERVKLAGRRDGSRRGAEAVEEIGTWPKSAPAAFGELADRGDKNRTDD
jgi:DDE superfamily endonuclease